MQLLTSELKTFLSFAGPIKRYGLTPAQDCICINNNIISKTNLGQSCQMPISVEGSVLLEEDALKSVLSKRPNAEIITIRQGANIVIECEGISVPHPKYDLKHFPNINKLPDGDGIKLDTEAVESIFIAAQFTSNQENAGSLRCVHIKKDYIAASDGAKFFYYTTNGLDNFILNIEDVSLISKLKEPSLYKGDNFYCAKAGDVTYTFINTESGTPNFEAIHSNISGEGIKFTVKKQDFVDYCRLVSELSKSKISLSEINGAGFVLHEDGHSVTLGLDLPEINFTFNSRLIQSAISILPLSDLNFELIKTVIVIKEDNYIIAFNKSFE